MVIKLLNLLAESTVLAEGGWSALRTIFCKPFVLKAPTSTSLTYINNKA